MSIDVSFIIVSYNTCALLDACLQSIYRHTHGIAFEIIVVDNVSADGSLEMVRKKYPAVRLLCNETNEGFGRANNHGAELAAGRYLLLINSDAQLEANTGGALADFLDGQPRAAAAGPLVLLPDGSRQPRTYGNRPGLRTVFNDSFLLSALFPDSPFFQGLHIERAGSSVTEAGWLSGVCIMFRRTAFEDVGGFDPSFFMYAEDIDICIRLGDRGWKLFRLDGHAITHHLGASSKTERQIIVNSLMQQRHFLKMLEAGMGTLQMSAVRLIMACGLVMRFCAGLACVLLGRPGGRRLTVSSARRLAALLGVPDPAPGDERCA